MQKVEKYEKHFGEIKMAEIKGTEIEESIYIFGKENKKWICKDRIEAVENYKNQLKNKVKAEELSILELKETGDEEGKWSISEISLKELINELY